MTNVLRVRAGDWVRFYQGGELIIGVVAYVRPCDSWGSGGRDVITDRGSTWIANVLEVRSATTVDSPDYFGESVL